MLLFTAGGALRRRPVFVLGPRFSGLMAIQPRYTLVTDGIYGVIRHPSHVGLLVNALGVGPCLSVWGRLAAHGTTDPAVARPISARDSCGRSFGAEYETFAPASHGYAEVFISLSAATET